MEQEVSVYPGYILDPVSRENYWIVLWNPVVWVLKVRWNILENLQIEHNYRTLL